MYTWRRRHPTERLLEHRAQAARLLVVRVHTRRRVNCKRATRHLVPLRVGNATLHAMSASGPAPAAAHL